MSKYSTQHTPKELMEAYALRVKKLRKSRKWTQEEFSERSGVALGTFRKFERTGVISLESFLLICQALGTLADLEEFMKEDTSQDLKALFDV
jgi:transcriptional regulator with XRE-family HTH domain